MQVYLRSSQGWYVEYNNSSTFSGASLGNQIESTFNRSYGDGVVIYSGKASSISARITSAILAPYTGTYTFSIVSDDGSNISVDGNSILSLLGTTWSCSGSASINLVAGYRKSLCCNPSKLQKIP